jgi:TPR repeat protein
MLPQALAARHAAPPLRRSPRRGDWSIPAGTAVAWAFSAGLALIGAPAAAQSAAQSATTLDGNMIVDCLLPGAVRKLGAGVTFLTPRKVAKVAVKECEVRGGEYVLFDRADPATALKIWQPAADQGDAVAQYRVGQIREMGINGTPDYQAAAAWYRKAADQGHRAAAFNLAVLYEKGLGVTRDPAVALTLYRRAQGLPDAVAGLDDVRALRDNLKAAQKRITELEREIAVLRQTGGPTTQKEQELKDARARIDDLLGGGKPVPIDLIVDVGAAAGGKPSIQLIEPSLVATRGSREVLVRSEIQTKQIVGRVKARNGLASLAVNGAAVQPDRYGFFDADVAVSPGGTPVRIVAVDRQGERDEVSLQLLPAKAKASGAPRPPVKVASGAFGNYHALVIGNDRYQSWGQLRTAVNDANAVAELLRRKYGFRTTVLTNATFEQTLNALNDYVKTLADNDNLLVYYAGHGHFDLGKRGYWIPVDADADRDTRWILDVHITDLLLKMNARKVLVVADSCYSGTLAEAENGAVPTVWTDVADDVRLSADKRLAEMHTRTVLTSGGLQPVWDGISGSNSVFATAFLDVLAVNDSVLEGYRLFDAVEGRVIKASQEIRQSEQRRGQKAEIESDQTPLYAGIQHAGHQGGDFIFVPVAQ